MHQDPKVLFLSVNDNQSKLSRITHIIHDHFYRGDNILISVPSDEAAAFIDNLLWKSPEDSFLPHVIAKGPVKDRIAISTVTSNLNQANTLLNLIPSVPPHAKDCKMIYDLLDLTHPAKEELSRKRIADYQSYGWKVDVV